jgi:hypothetical protein
MKMTKEFARRFLFTAGLVALLAFATPNVTAQQRDPNQPRPTPTPTPTPVIKLGNRPVVTTTRDQGAGGSPTKLPGIYGQIRWKKELGLPYDVSQVRAPYPLCNIFRVRITMQDAGSPGSFGATRTLGDFDLSGNPADLGEFYACGYGLADKGLLPRNRTMVVSAELDTRVLRGRENGQWSVGGDALPPPGQQRTIIIIGGRNAGITLSDNQPHATLDFEMLYRPIPAMPR